MQNKHISLEQLSDIYAFRVVTDSVEDCYRALGVAHTTWSTVPGRFKDYISTPKQNSYRSIHTTIVGPRHQRVELQIRTRAMHDVAEYGVAAHALYKDGAFRRRRRARSGQRREVRRRGRALRLAAPPRRDAARRQQPRGVPGAHQARAVPRPGVLLHAEGPPDRAAARRHRHRLRLRRAHRHRQRRVGALINGRHMPLTTVLRNGDEVQIATSREQRPRRRPGRGSPSPAAPAPRSAAPRARPCASSTASSAAA